MHDPTDDPAIVNPLDATDIGRQMRLDPQPLLVAQPKQIPAHGTNPFQNESGPYGIRIALQQQQN
jgi:hypothetical protein